MKRFFNIIERNYQFEWADISTLLTIANVALILCGVAWAPWIGIVNCGLALVLGAINRTHINTYVMQIALIILNAYFLTL